MESSESELEILELTSPNNVEAANITCPNSIPEVSKEKYKTVYNTFMDWCNKDQKTNSVSENVLLTYFDELSKKFKVSTLWAQYSMLRTTLNINNNIDIARYVKLRTFLKQKSDGYRPKKSKSFTSEEINRFVEEAPDSKYLLAKVVLVVGVMGACRREELHRMKITDFRDLGSAVLVKVPNPKTKAVRKFTITGHFYEIFKRYVNLRPQNSNQPCFFLNYQKGKCTVQKVGINKFGNLGKYIAAYLKIPNPELYTGHCFRRSSSTILVDSSGDITSFKRHDGQKSTAVAEGHIKEFFLKNTTTELKRDPEPAKQPYVPVNMVLLPETTDRSQQFTSTSSSFTTPDPLTSVEEPSRRSDISQDKNLPPKPTLNNLTFMNIKSKQSKAFDKSKPSEDCEERIYCRLCLKPTNKNSSTALWVDDVNYPEKNDALKKKQSDKVQEILKMLQFCLPFFDLLTFNPIICCICLERLRISYKFMDECLKNQRLIEHYADTRGSSTEKIVNIAEMIETKFTLSNTERKIPAHIPDNSINNATKRSSQQIKTEKYSDEDNTASKKQKICHELQNDDSLTVSNIETANVKIEPDTDAFSALTELLTRDIPRGEIESGNIDEETIIKIEPNYIDCPDFIKTELEDDLHIKNELFNKRTGIGTDIGQEGQRSHFDETGNDPLHKANISFFRREPIFLNIDSNIETITSDVIK